MTVCKKEHPSLCAVLLAAGASRRFGGDNKLLADIGGTPLVRRVAEQLLSSRVAGVVVVTGFEGDKVRGSLAGLDIQLVENTDYADGLGSSLRCGVAALPKGVAGAMIVLADMPGITTALFDRLIGVFEQEAICIICVRFDNRSRVIDSICDNVYKDQLITLVCLL